ncbi:HAD family hydrolase [Deinococcus yunweiensis]|uniref:HAD family hydrolase n=1 Tax=Deinococcus yunweiensis TaxID=367282 RepID=UPI00398E4D2F
MTIPTPVVVFADLDDTLFQTRRKLRGDEGELTPATLMAGRDEPHSFMTPAQARLLALLDAPGVTVVPVTGRDLAAMSRVILPFPSWVIADHGATILEPGGAVHTPWADLVRPALAGHAATLLEIQARSVELAQIHDLRVSAHRAHDEVLMLVAKHPDAAPEGLRELQLQWSRWSEGTPLHVIANANNLTVMPRAPGKRQAVEYLQRHAFGGAALTLGLGDSVSDVPFMATCDFAVTPTRGQLMRAMLATDFPQH